MDDWIQDAWKTAEAKKKAASDELLEARVMQTRVILQLRARGFTQEETAAHLGYMPVKPGGQAKGKLTTYFRAANALEKAGRVGLAIDAPITDADREAVAVTWGDEAARVKAHRSGN
jgi:hypothetical protein